MRSNNALQQSTVTIKRVLAVDREGGKQNENIGSLRCAGIYVSLFRCSAGSVFPYNYSLHRQLVVSKYSRNGFVDETVFCCMAD